MKKTKNIKPMKLKVADPVVVIAGKYKGTETKVLQVLPRENAYILENVNLVKRAYKPSQTNPSGGIVEKNMPIHASKVAYRLENGKVSKIGFTRSKDGDKIRITKKDGKEIK
jgi:large subunit ribosomal protein L24